MTEAEIALPVSNNPPEFNTPVTINQAILYFPFRPILVADKC